MDPSESWKLATNYFTHVVRYFILFWISVIWELTVWHLTSCSCVFISKLYPVVFYIYVYIWGFIYKYFSKVMWTWLLSQLNLEHFATYAIVIHFTTQLFTGCLCFLFGTDDHLTLLVLFSCLYCMSILNVCMSYKAYRAQWANDCSPNIRT